MKTEIKLITPAIAEEMLKMNTMNRMLLKDHLWEYARLMRNGLWKENSGEPIKIATDGTILDGQYRLNALILTKISLEFLIVSDLEKDIFTVLDSGKRRSSYDVLHIAGVSQAGKVSSMVIRYIKLHGGKVLSEDGTRYISSSEILSMYNSRSKFWDAVVLMSESWYVKSQHILSGADIGGVYAFLHGINEEDAFTFMDILCTGVNLEFNNPIKLLRDKLIFSRINKKFSFTKAHKTALIFKAWNLFRNKKTIKILKYDSNVEDFPIPI